MRRLSLGLAWVWSTLVLYAQSLIGVAPPEQRGTGELLGAPQMALLRWGSQLLDVR